MLIGGYSYALVTPARRPLTLPSSISSPEYDGIVLSINYRAERAVAARRVAAGASRRRDFPRDSVITRRGQR